MTIPEACGLWIEQRLKQEIKKTGDTRKSVRSIAEMVTGEVTRPPAKPEASITIRIASIRAPHRTSH